MGRGGETRAPPPPSTPRHHERIFDRAASSSRCHGPQEARPFKATRRVWEKKNPLDFFHVCPLLLHEKMGGGAGRPVHKLVFACPGRAGALVSPHDEGAGFVFFFLCVRMVVPYRLL